MDANELLRDRTIRHMMYLERFKSGEADRIVKFLDEVIVPDLLAQIEKRLRNITDKGFDAGPQTTKRMQELAAALHEITLRFGKDDLRPSLLDLAGDEVDFQLGITRQAIGVDVEMVLPAPETLAQIVDIRPFGGHTLGEWFKSLQAGTQLRLMGAIQQGLAEGETTDSIVRRVRGTKSAGFADGVLQTTRNQAEAIVRTAVAHVSNNARSELFKENADIIESVQWVSTLDSRTSPTCQARDGKIFPVDKGPRPPAHVNCRSSIVPVLKSWKSLGIDAEELPEGTRASMNGQVPAGLTYGQWLKKQPRSVVEDALGKTRAKLFIEGKLDIERFTDQRNKPLSLDQLRKRERDAFERAGVTIH